MIIHRSWRPRGLCIWTKSEQRRPPLEEYTKLPLQLHETVPTVHTSPVSITNEQSKPQMCCESWSRYTLWRQCQNQPKPTNRKKECGMKIKHFPIGDSPGWWKMTPAQLELAPVGNGLKAKAALWCVCTDGDLSPPQVPKNTDPAVCTSGRGHLPERRLKLVSKHPNVTGHSCSPLVRLPPILPACSAIGQ